MSIHRPASCYAAGKNPIFALPSMQYPEVDNEGRRIYSAMVTGMDMAVGQIVEALKENDLYDNSFLLFSSDVMIMIHCIKANLE